MKFQFQINLLASQTSTLRCPYNKLNIATILNSTTKAQASRRSTDTLNSQSSQTLPPQFPNNPDIPTTSYNNLHLQTPEQPTLNHLKILQINLPPENHPNPDNKRKQTRTINLKQTQTNSHNQLQTPNSILNIKQQQQP